MREQNLTMLPITRSDGVLLGVLRRDDAEQALRLQSPRATDDS
jgi:hypothetical protein